MLAARISPQLMLSTLPAPTIWQACLSQLAAHLQSQGQDPATAIFLASRNHLSLFALGETGGYCLSVFGQHVTPLAVSPGERAAFVAGKLPQAFPFGWAAA